MLEEIAAAVVFMKRLVKTNNKLTEEQVEQFCDCLSAILVEKFRNHWYVDDPMKGQAYRCIRINDSGPADAILDKAAMRSGIRYSDLNMPPELTLWVDPKEVCCRFSELKGHCCTVASFRDGQCDNKALTLDLDDLLETQRQQRLDDLTRLRAHTSRRSNRDPTSSKTNNSHYHSSTKFNSNVKNNNFHHHHGGNNNGYSSKAPQYDSKLWNTTGVPAATSTTSAATTAKNSNAKYGHPKQNRMQYFSNAMKRDPFHWVRGQDLVKA